MGETCDGLCKGVDRSSVAFVDGRGTCGNCGKPWYVVLPPTPTVTFAHKPPMPEPVRKLLRVLAAEFWAKPVSEKTQNAIAAVRAFYSNE